MSNPFIFNSRRVASDAIRGFYYQIELTVLRWLELDGNDFLYCECGEDIDHIKVPVNQSLDSALLEERILEQIKDISASITLKNREAITALARYHEAIVQNPTGNIKFRFSTTTYSGREQSITFPRKANGIAIWEDIRNGIIDGQEADEFVTAFKQIISEAERPQKLSQEVFDQFKTYVTGSDNQTIIVDLIKRFEWATGLPDPPSLESQMQSILINRVHANNVEEANQLINDLKVYVLELLITDGEKKLTIAELETYINNKSSITIDRRRLTRIENFINQVSEDINDLRSQFGQLAQQFSDYRDTNFSFQLPLPDVPPASLEGFANRDNLVNNFQSLLTDKPWLHITGASGMGKTYFAKLLAESSSTSQFEWISLGGELSSEGLRYKLERHLLRIANNPYISELVRRYSTGGLTPTELVRLAASRIGTGNILVIDELPDLTQKEYRQLAERLEQLFAAFHPCGVKLITTGQKALPPSIINRSSNRIIEQPIPPLSDEDIVELTSTLGAPADLLNHRGYINLISTATQGHPQLVFATILYIRNNGWVIDEDKLILILKGDATTDIREEAQRKIRDLLRSDSDLRELLYRLSLISRPFDKSFVTAVAKVTEPIRLALELFVELIGPWVVKLSANQFDLTPLLKNIGKEVLDAELQKQVHIAIASQYMQKRRVTPSEAFQIIYHLTSACQWSRLIFLIFSLTLKIKERFHAEYFELIPFYFSQGWPEDIPIQLRILLRSAQIRILAFLDKDAQQLVDDLDSMIEQVKDQKDEATLSIVLLAHAMVSLLNPSLRPEVAAQRTLKMVQLFPFLPESLQRLQSKSNMESNIWMGLQNIKTQDEIQNTLSVLIKMSEEQRKAAFAYQPFSDAPRIFADQCWMLELDKPAEERDWNKTYTLICELQKIAELPGATPLKAPIIRAKAIILSEHLSRVEDAINEIEIILSDLDDCGQFLLNYTAGYILLISGETERALGYFQKALINSSPDNLLLQYDALRYALEAAGKAGNKQLQFQFTFRAFKIINALSKDIRNDIDKLNKEAGDTKWEH